jgi:trimeric autotransporter adhesin
MAREGDRQMISKFQKTILTILFLGVNSFAGVPTSMTFQTKILLPGGSALEAGSVNFRFTILDSVGTCILYVEDFSGVNMTGSQGVVSFPLGSGTKQFPATATNLYEVFNNSAASYPCQAGGTYSPSGSQNRQIVMQFNDGSGWQTVPQMAINGVPYANYATRADSLGSYVAADFLRPTTLPICGAGQALHWDGTVFTCVTASLGAGGITQNGNAFSTDVTIGTTDLYGIKLNTNGVTRMVIDNSGNIGIGTTTPSALLDLASTSTPQFKTSYDGANYYTTGVSSLGAVTFDANGAFPLFNFTDALSVNANSTGSLYGIYLGRNLNDSIAQANQYGLLVDVTRNAATAGVSDRIYGQKTTVNRGGGSTSSNTVVYGSDTSISHTGAASGTVQTYGNSVSITADTNGVSSAYGSSISVGGADLNFGTYILMNSLPSTTNYGLYVDVGNGAGTKYAAVFQNGSVGIGTGTPVYALDVVGDVNVTGNFRVNGSVLSGGGGGPTLNGVMNINNLSGDITLAPATATGAVQINSGSASTGPTTGALIVNGGVGVSGGIYSGGSISSGSTISANSSMYTPQLFGTSTPSGNIFIEGTSNATKGNVILANAGGNVGIGTSTPQDKLHIVGGGVWTQADGLGFYGDSYSATAGYHVPFVGRRARGTIASPTHPLSGDALAAFLGTNAISELSWSGMGVLATENHSSSAQGAELRFYTVPNGTKTTTTRVVVSNNGNVGIGTTTPPDKLSVSQADADVKISLTNTSSTTQRSPSFVIRNYQSSFPGSSGEFSAISFRGTQAAPSAVQNGDLLLSLAGQGGYNSSGNYQYGAALDMRAEENFSGTAAGTMVRFFTASLASSTLTEKMRITANGNVGIGQTSPTAKLDVGGSLVVSGSITTWGTSTGAYAATSAALATPAGSFWNPTNTSNTDGAGSFVVPTVRNAAATNQRFYLGSVSNTGGYSPEIVLGQQTGATAYAERIRISASGAIGIGTTSPQTALQVAGVIAPSANNTYSLGNASFRFTEVYATNGVINTSDRREKKEIDDSKLGLEFIRKLRPVSYRWNTGVDEDIHYGLIAQEAEEAIKQEGQNEKTSIVVRDEKTDRYGVRYSELISPLIKAAQELYQRIVEINRDVISLKEENRILKQESAALKAYLCRKDKDAGFCK